MVAVVVQGRDGQQEDSVTDGNHVERGTAEILCVQVELDVTTASRFSKIIFNKMLTSVQSID